MSFGVTGTPISSARHSAKNFASPKVSATKDSARSAASQNNDWNVFMNSATALNLDSGRSEKYAASGRIGKTESKLNNKSSLQGDGNGRNLHQAGTQVFSPNKSPSLNIRSETPTKRSVGADEKKSNVGVRRFNSQGNLPQSSRETLSASTRLQPGSFAVNDGFGSSRNSNAKLTTFNAFDAGDSSRGRNDERIEAPVKLELGNEEENRELVRAMLQQKYSEKMNQQKEERNDLQAVEESRRRARELKAKEARQEAIEELRKKREVMRAAEQDVQGEMAYLQDNCRIGKRNGSVSSKQQQAPSKSRAANFAVRQSVVNQDDMLQSSAPKSAFEESEVDEVGSARRGDDDDDVDRHQQMSAAGDASSQVSKTTVTLDELFETLKTLEKVEEFDKSTARSHSQSQATKKTTLEWLDDLETSERDGANVAAASFRLHDNGSSSSREAAVAPVQSALSEQKIRSIMNYLDEVDTAERLTEMDFELERSNQQLDRPAMLVPGSKEIEELNEQAAATTAEITQAMLTQRLELEEKRRSVLMLQKALNQQRELTVRHAKETEKEMKKRLDVQKDEYEEAVKRHLSFIDQLIDDKKMLAEKYEAVVKEMKTSERKYQDKVKAMQDSHQVELDKVKEMHAAAEKLRRERWIEEKTKKIKEMTVKGLEPEIQRLIAQHKTEVKKIKSVHEAELLHSDERAAQKYVKMTEELREQLHQEKEAACARERELARQTYEKQLQQEEEALQQQRRRLHAEVHEEKERLTAQAARQRQELDRLQLKLEESQASAVQSMRIEYEKARDEQERRHAVEVRQLREQLALEKAAWEENVMKKHEALLGQREREMQKHVLSERDKEIELVIERLEADNRASREECERVAENRIKRIREKYESEMAELERNEKSTTEKYNQTKANLVEAEGENERLHVLLAQKEKDIADLKKLLTKLNEERDRVSDVVRQEFADRIVATEEENKRLKNDMSELKARHRIELERAKVEIEAAKKVKDEEMEEVHKRVKQAILKKEEVVSQLREQHEAALKRADHLEGLLEQQRKQLLAKK